MSAQVEKLLKVLTLEEKASLCSGQDFWTTKAIARLGIPSWIMTDGPHGLRKQRPNPEEVSLHDSVPATCFPSGAGLASTWNPKLIEQVGKALGLESKAEQVGVILGPAVNIKRSPLCGRNFEYLSEDPYLAGQIAKHHILGVQSQGVGTSLKHFAANNQETLRMTIDTVVDERTLREIYLPAFEIAVKEAQPWTVMCSYNKLNGTFASENQWLLTKILKEEWGHTGLVVTDWGACNDRVAGLKAGQELEMPGNGGLNDQTLVAAAKDGTLKQDDLDRAVRRILDLTMKVMENLDTGATFNADSHHLLARQVAAEGMVLLKNEGELLPLAGKKSLAFVGAFARHPRYQGGGSSHIRPTRLDDLLAEARLVAPDVEISYAAGYSLSTQESDEDLLAQASESVKRAEAAVVFIGLTDAFESEGFDRTHLGIPGNQVSLLHEVLKVQKNVVVVLSNGSPIEMPWAEKVPAILESYLGGQAWGGAVADILFGRVNPSGRLAESFPVRLEDNPSFLNFPGEPNRVEYREGIFVGYRHYDAVKIPPLFPFGHGLSYTTFSYDRLVPSSLSLTEGQILGVKVEVSNVGEREGAEVVQLYVGAVKSTVIRPVRELRAFAKINLDAGKSETISLSVDDRAFSFWSTLDRRWVVETGEYEVSVGSSSRDIRGSIRVHVEASRPRKFVYDQNSTLGELADNPRVGGFIQAKMKELRPLFGTYDDESGEAKMMDAMVREMPLRNLIRMSGGKFAPKVLEDVLAVLDGRESEDVLR